MNEDDPDFMRELAARVEQQREHDDDGEPIIVLQAAMPPKAWGALLADEARGLSADRYAVLYLALFTFVSLLYVLDLMWRPIAALYVVLGVMTTLNLWRWYRMRRTRFDSITGFIERARDDDDG